MVAATPEQKIEVLRSVRKIVMSKHLDLHEVHHEWSRRVEEVESELAALGTDDTFVAGVQHLLSGLRTSHTGFFRRHSSPVPARFAMQAVLTPVNVNGSSRWMIADVFEGGPAALAGLKQGDLLLTVDGAAVAPPEDIVLRLGEEHRFTVRSWSSAATREAAVTIPAGAPQHRPPMTEVQQPVTCRLLDSTTGYLKVSAFPSTLGIDFAKSLDRAVAEIGSAGAHRLIIDVRNNPGGALGSLRLMSYLCADRREATYTLSRPALAQGRKKEGLPAIGRIPANLFDRIMLMVRFGILNRDRSMTLRTEGLGSRPFHGRIVLLVNENTRSAAEMVAAFAAENRLATIVGARTAGEVVGAANFRVWPSSKTKDDDPYMVRIPVVATFTWGGTLLEGNGIAPDCNEVLDPESLAKGFDSQLNAAKRVAAGL